MHRALVRVPLRDTASRPPPRRAGHTARFALLATTAMLQWACAHEPPSPAPGFSEPRPDGSLEVRLVFGEAADLDLFVSDPLQEALYFGNNPSRSGGALDVNRRCDSPAPRVEIARFRDPLPGRYRVGVSYDQACGLRGGPAPFEVRVETDALSRREAGEIARGEFEHIVLEFDLPPTSRRVPTSRRGARPAGPQELTP